MMNQMSSVTTTTPSTRSVPSISGRLRNLIAEMQTRGVPYQDALREFEGGYIVHILRKQGGHLGKTASSLGMHRNTLTRTLRKLGRGGPKTLPSSTVSEL
jgi:DNA-binding NtrC family response regulator